MVWNEEVSRHDIFQKCQEAEGLIKKIERIYSQDIN